MDDMERQRDREFEREREREMKSTKNGNGGAMSIEQKEIFTNAFKFNLHSGLYLSDSFNFG